MLNQSTTLAKEFKTRSMLQAWWAIRLKGSVCEPAALDAVQHNVGQPLPDPLVDSNVFVKVHRQLCYRVRAHSQLFHLIIRRLRKMLQHKQAVCIECSPFRTNWSVFSIVSIVVCNGKTPWLFWRSVPQKLGDTYDE
jgi:hypothetical protein